MTIIFLVEIETIDFDLKLDRDVPLWPNSVVRSLTLDAKMGFFFLHW